jgi:hypothetical protein
MIESIMLVTIMLAIGLFLVFRHLCLNLSLSRLLSNPNDFFMSSSSSSSLQCNDNNDSVRITNIIVKNSLLYSCSKQISVKKPKNKKEVVVQVYAFYHKDIDATAKTAHLMINEAIRKLIHPQTIFHCSMITTNEVVQVHKC